MEVIPNGITGRIIDIDRLRYHNLDLYRVELENGLRYSIIGSLSYFDYELILK